MLSSVHISPKTRYPHDILKKVAPGLIWGVWDIGGADILTNTSSFANLHFVKGHVWKDWLIKQGSNVGERIFVTGSPHYDEYLLNDAMKKSAYLHKYKLTESSRSILILPTNPRSHLDMWNKNLNELNYLIDTATTHNFDVCVKTYPFDYLLRQKEKQYTGVYHRTFPATKNKMQWEYLQDKFPTIKIIDSHDHFEAIKNCTALINISGSHVAWETHFVKARSFTLNYSDQKFYKCPSYLKDVDYPDEVYNIELTSANDIISRIDSDAFTKYPDDFILAENAVENIVRVIKELI